MSHVVGTVQTVTPAKIIGPASGSPATSANTWAFDLSPAPPPIDVTKYVLLHFRNANFPAGARLEVDLGYGTDVFTAADGTDFWARPANVYALAGGKVPIRYVTTGTTGSVELFEYGRGERHHGELDATALSNCDPFLKDATYQEPDYDPYWYCTDPPNWENAAKATDAIRSGVLRSVGMIVGVELSHYSNTRIVSTCSVTLIDSDKVITAGH